MTIRTVPTSVGTREWFITEALSRRLGSGIGTRRIRIRNTMDARPFVCILVVLASTVPVEAQVHQIYGGNALDANPQYGSGGRNTAIQRPKPNNANLYITGNVTRGQQFRGFSPILDPSQMFVGLPSSSLGRFRADGVSAGDLRSGRFSRQAQPYFLPETTVTNRGALAAGLNRPGSSMPRSPYTIPRAGRRRSPPAEFNLRPPTDQRPRGDALRPPLLTHASLLGGMSGLTPFSSLSSVGSTRFGLRQPNYAGQDPYSWQGLRPTLKPGALAPGTRALGQSQDQSMTDPVTGLPAKRQDERTGRSGIGLQTDQGISTRRRAQGTLLGRILDRPRTGGPVSPRMDTRVEGMVGGDSRIRPYRVLSDPTAESSNRLRPILRADQAYDQANVTGASSRSPGQGRLAPSGGIRSLKPGEKPPLLAPAYDRIANFSHNQAGKILHLLAAPIRTFVGSGDLLVDKYFQKAETYLLAGKYYRAAGQFGIAIELERSNPLSPLGKAHAMIGAGDFISAEHQIERAISIYPGIAQFQLDLTALLPTGDIVARRRTEIEQRLAGPVPDQERYRLQFVLGYLQWYSGMQEAGLKNLTAAAEASPADSPVRQFVIYAREFADEASLKSSDDPSP